MFARGNVASATLLIEALEEFKNVSGLVPSMPKSTAFFCNVANHVKNSILQVMPFEEGKLPIKYLGVSLISWQLVTSMLSSLHVYWASMFILPAGIIHDIEKLMNGFLWCLGEMKREACGMLESMLMSVGDGGKSSKFAVGFVLTCGIVLVMEKVLLLGLIANNSWKWPVAWYNLFPVLNQVALIELNNDHVDKLYWKTLDGQEKEFSIRSVWDNIRAHRDEVGWDDIIAWIVSISKFKTVSSVVGSLVLAASSYYVWQERSNRLFSKGERRVEELRDIITDVVRLKLASLRFKSTARVERLITFWKLPSFVMNTN
ncbi:hypothetical protein Tco_0823227 [Tanacetum coccineum]|uniref:Reverse transcriptase zinc-binding domain-containing protein n=1 Tax=Tanacetum coccineum TaxID=301880 RepID=A0ABQ5ALM7_9ASTR